jgi:hypothetical protein
MGDYLQFIHRINKRKLESIFEPRNYDTYLSDGYICDAKNIPSRPLSDYDDDDVSGTAGLNNSISSGESAKEVESGDEDEDEDDKY